MNDIYICNLIGVLWVIAATLSKSGKIPFAIVGIIWLLNGLIQQISIFFK